MVRAVATAQYILEFRAWSCNQVDARFGTGPLDLVEYAIREVRHDNVWLKLFFFCHVNVTEGQNVKQVLWNGVDRVCLRMRLAFVFLFGRIFCAMFWRFVRSSDFFENFTVMAVIFKKIDRKLGFFFRCVLASL